MQKIITEREVWIALNFKLIFPMEHTNKMPGKKSQAFL